VIPSVAAGDADTCFELRFVDAEGFAAPGPATVIRAIFCDKRRLSERL
jgi:hypothetical protein